ncbi:hypothetical protein M0R04_10395 [Candidatus Dojkabacteria bacterium]|jgi:hypothetical protein|nr:hypothetical protein [Candidatus Dojkabacteria bacterium]
MKTKEKIKKIICGGGNPKNIKSLNWTDKGLDYASEQIITLFIKELLERMSKKMTMEAALKSHSEAGAGYTIGYNVALKECKQLIIEMGKK